MPAHFVALSDLHLGYDCSVLNDPAAQDLLVGAIADLCGGAADRLVLNGDCFEACVPRDAGQHDVAGFPPSMAVAARSFFQKFTDKIVCSSLVLLWGNHDYCMWQRLASSCGIGTFTNNLKGDVLLQHERQTLPGAEGFLDDVIGPARWKFLRIRSAYPNYVLGRYWPYVVFHHGHLLDRLILGWQPGIDYLALKILIGEGSPKVSRDGDETIESIHRKTEPFISAMWRFNCKARAEEWAFLRRGEKSHVCAFHPAEMDSFVSKNIDYEIQGDQLGLQAEWYATTLLMDATTPGTIGPANVPGYLFIGHDHDGGREDLMGPDGHIMKLINLGGWTADRNEESLHTHVSVWSEDVDKPSVHCVKV